MSHPQNPYSRSKTPRFFFIFFKPRRRGLINCVSLLVRQPLAAALRIAGRAFSIGEAEGGTVIEAEIKFREITVQVLFFAVLICSAHTAFEHRKISFDSISGYVTASIFVDR